MKNLKNGLLGLLAMSAVGGMMAPKANAGVALLALSGGSSAMMIAGGVGVLAGGSAIFFEQEENGDINKWTNPLTISGIVLVALDANGGLPQNQVRVMLQKKYSFIENSAVFDSLSQLIKDKADHQSYVNGKKMVSISNEELMNALQPVDLTGFESQVHQMSIDLQ